MQQPQQYKQNLFQVLSMDVVLGALSTGLFAVILLGVSPVSAWWFVLPLSVWTVYTMDHIVDGYKKKENSSMFRHWFHNQHRKKLLYAMLFTGLTSAVLSFIFLDLKIIYGGICLFCVVLLYLAIVYVAEKYKAHYFQKEFFIAVIYISGIFLAPLIWYGSFPPFNLLFIIVVLIILAWMEGAIASCFDFVYDQQDGYHSFAIWLGQKRARMVLIIVGTLTGLSMIIMFLTFTSLKIRLSLGIEFLMLFLLFMMVIFPRYFKSKQRFRWIGEGVFYLPGLIVMFL